MVRLRVLNGSRAGADHTASQFPCTIGRASNDDLQLTDPGVWENHLQLDMQSPGGFRVSRLGQGRASVNGAEFDELILHNGDVIELGAVNCRTFVATNASATTSSEPKPSAPPRPRRRFASGSQARPSARRESYATS